MPPTFNGKVTYYFQFQQHKRRKTNSKRQHYTTNGVSLAYNYYYWAIELDVIGIDGCFALRDVGGLGTGRYSKLE